MVIGGSGTGKSVLLRSIIGLKRPEGGDIEVLGHDVLHADDPEARAIEQRWGVLFQDGALFSSLTVMQNIEVPLREHCPMPETLMDEIAACKIALVGCYEGFQVERNAASVGLLTTRSVVESVFLVIVLDAAFSVMFSVLGV